MLAAGIAQILRQTAVTRGRSFHSRAVFAVGALDGVVVPDDEEEERPGGPIRFSRL